MTFVYVFLPYTVQDGRTVRYLGLYVSMDSLNLTLASFSQRYLAEAQDDINVLLFLVFICIGVECLGTFCSVLFGFRKCNKIILPILSGYLESVLQVPQAQRFCIFCSINTIKPMQASHLPMFLYGTEA